ncbi:MAG: hypothetical protein NUW01_15395 [Gemmatimonadaceae bacterium]|nr:hypothetical protein [Gemmatimonadaceae bacterium]
MTPAAAPVAPPAPRLAPSVMIPPPVAPSTRPVFQPTAVPGKQRVRIAVTGDDIMMRNPHMLPEIRERAVMLILAVNVDDTSDRVAILWGHDAQKAYATLVEQSLTLSQSELLATVMRYVNRMTELLSSIDLKRVCGLDSGGMFSFLRRTTKSIDTPEELETARVELSQLVSLMHQSIDPLLALKEKIEAVSTQTEQLGFDIEALAEAGAFVADHLSAKDPAKASFAQRFMERSGSLTQSLAQIRSGGSVREMQVEHPLRLITAVQHATLVAMPGWLSSITTILSMLRSARKPNVTEVDELGVGTRKIIEGLTV